MIGCKSPNLCRLCTKLHKFAVQSQLCTVNSLQINVSFLYADNFEIYQTHGKNEDGIISFLLLLKRTRKDTENAFRSIVDRPCRHLWNKTFSAPSWGRCWKHLILSPYLTLSIIIAPIVKTSKGKLAYHSMVAVFF